MLVDVRSNVVAVPELIAELEQTNDAHRLEIVADLLGRARDPHAIVLLLTRLCDPLVQRNGDAEEALCAALVALGVMSGFGSLRYTLLHRHMLDRDVVTTVTELADRVPLRYFFTPR